MTTIGERILSSVLGGNAGIRLIEPHIYSVLRDVQMSNEYDSRFGYVYDWVACNSIYNRLIWGYPVSRFAALAADALNSSKRGNMLDVGCGSLAFTAGEYIRYSGRPVVLVDQSLKMLRIAKSRLIKLNREVPDNMVFLHADATDLPFEQESFNTIISQNLLHCVTDTKKLLAGLRRILAGDGRIYFTTLVKVSRFADKYLQALADGGKLVPRNMADHQKTFDELGMDMKYEISGNMAFIYYG